ncbi:MAG: phosphatase PAP2 family protein [Pseudomonadota bacterium]
MVDAITRQDASTSPHASLASRLWRSYAPLLVLWLIYFIAVSVVITPLGYEVVVYDAQFVPSYLVCVGAFATLALTWMFITKIVLRGDVPFRRRVSDLARGDRWLELLFLGTVPPLLFVFTMMRLFKSFKPTIPELVPFSWDYTFRDWDRLLFLGYDGWEITHTLMPWHAGTWFIDRLYVFWFPIVLFTVCANALSPLASRRRLAFFLAFALNWIIAGSVIATIFSSAGPVYFDRILGDDTFIPLIHALTEVQQTYRLTVLFGIELLWDAHVGIPGMPTHGISAFPSLHVAMAMLVCLYLWSCNVIWRWLGVAFLILTLFGSVHLGWHYVVDGLASILICWVLWVGSVRFARWWIPDNEAAA